MQTRRNTTTRSNEQQESVTLAPVFQPVVAPRLESVDRKSIIQFERNRENYNEQIKAQKDATGDSSITAVRLKNMIEPMTLKLFCSLYLGKSKEEATDEEVEGQLNTLINKSAEIAGEMTEIMTKNLHMNLSIEDVNARVFDLYKQFEEICEIYGLNTEFEGENVKKKVKFLIKGIRPARVREVVEHEVEYKHKEAKKDPKKLYKVILDNAISQQRFRQEQKKWSEEKKRKIPYENDKSKRYKKNPKKETPDERRKFPDNNKKLDEFKTTFDITKVQKNTCFGCGLTNHLLPKCRKVTQDIKNYIFTELKNKKEKENPEN